MDENKKEPIKVDTKSTKVVVKTTKEEPKQVSTTKVQTVQTKKEVDPMSVQSSMESHMEENIANAKPKKKSLMDIVTVILMMLIVIICAFLLLHFCEKTTNGLYGDNTTTTTTIRTETTTALGKDEVHYEPTTPRHTGATHTAYSNNDHSGDSSTVPREHQTSKQTTRYKETTTISTAVMTKPQGATSVVNATSITLDVKNVEMEVGDELALIATVLPETATGEIKWTSTSKNIVEVTNGNLKAKGKGQATITATINGKVARCYVTVKEKKVESTDDKKDDNKTEDDKTSTTTTTKAVDNKNVDNEGE